MPVISLRVAPIRRPLGPAVGEGMGVPSSAGELITIASGFASTMPFSSNNKIHDNLHQ